MNNGSNQLKKINKKKIRMPHTLICDNYGESFQSHRILTLQFEGIFKGHPCNEWGHQSQIRLPRA